MEQPSRSLSRSIKFERLQEPFRQIVGTQRNYVRPWRRPSRYNICAPNKIRIDGRMLETGTRGHHHALLPEIYYIIIFILLPVEQMETTADIAPVTSAKHHKQTTDNDNLLSSLVASTEPPYSPGSCDSDDNILPIHYLFLDSNILKTILSVVSVCPICNVSLRN